jgi:hypothetical protein
MDVDIAQYTGSHSPRKPITHLNVKPFVTFEEKVSSTVIK